jgi:hypothetical protein
LIRKIFLMIRRPPRSTLLGVGCIGQCTSYKSWEYQPIDFQVAYPKVRVGIGDRGLLVDWMTLNTGTSNSSANVLFYRWSDYRVTTKEGVAFRVRSLVISAFIVLCAGALFLAYPVIVFVRGPYRRYCWREIGCCPQCGYSLIGNVSGVCPECGKRVDPNIVRQTEKEISPPRRLWVALAVMVVVVLSLVQPRGELSRYLPAIIMHPTILPVVCILGIFACKRIQRAKRIPIWIVMSLMIMYLVYYVLFTRTW